MENDAPGGGSPPSQQQQQPTNAIGTATRQPVAPPPAAPPATPPAAPASKNERAAAAMPPEVLAARLKREREAASRAWVEKLGVKTPEEAAELVAKAKAADEAQQQARLAEMSEIDRLKEENAQLRARVAELESEKVQSIDALNAEKQDRMISAIASRHVDGDYVDIATRAFVRHLDSLDEKTVEGMTEAKVSRWFEGFVKQRPKLAKESSAAAAPPPAPAAPPKPAPKKITTGAPPVRKAPDGPPPKPTAPDEVLFEGKTWRTRPGFDNSMPKDVLSRYLTTKGIDYGSGPGAGRSRSARSAAQARAAHAPNGQATKLA